VNKVQEIKQAIDNLSARDRAELNVLLHDWFNDDWDDQMAADAAAGGKLDKLKQSAEAEARAGQLREFPKPYQP
jgi:hypothetical protein